MKALEQGIQLPNDDVYNQMLSEYPHYQYKVEQRQKQKQNI